MIGWCDNAGTMSIEVQQFLNDSGGNFTETAPRPPVPGEENELHSNGGTSDRSTGSYRSHLSGKSHSSNKSHRSECSPAATPRRSNLDKTINNSILHGSLHGDDHAPLGFEPEGSAASSPRFTENSPPAYLRWAENLIHLLDDSDGVKLFKQFLDQEQCANTLDFWFACRGLKLVASTDKDKIYNLVKLIYRKYIKGDQLCLKPEVKKRLVERLSKKENIDQTVFDEPQKEVEDLMRNDSYPLFLKSDLYVQYVQAGGESPKTSNNSSGSNSVRPTSGPLPTLQEDSELRREDLFKTPNNTMTLTQNALLATRYTRASRDTFKRPEGDYLQHHAPGRSNHANPYHVSYAPVSAQDSELQSLSSDALTDDTMSLTDSSVDGREPPMFGTKKWKQRQKAMHRNALMNRSAELNQLSVIPRTDRAPKDRNIAETDPAKFATILIERLDKVKDEQDKIKRIEDSMKSLEQMTDEEDVMNKSTTSAGQNMSMMALMSAAMAEKEREESNAQSILEEHCSRIWDSSAGQTPTYTPGRHSPDRTLARNRSMIAGPSPNVSGISISLPPKPNHIKRTKGDKDSHLTSMLSFDSGMGEDKSGVFSERLSSKHIHHHHHHHHSNKDIKSSSLNKSHSMELDPHNRSLAHHRSERLERSFSEFSRSWEEPGFSRGRSKDTKRSSNASKKSLDTSSNIDSGVSVRYEPTGFPANEKVLAWMLDNEKVHTTTQYSTDGSERSSSHKRSIHSHKSSSGTPAPHRQGAGKKPVQYNVSRSASLDRSLHLSASVSSDFDRPVLPTQPMVQDPSMPPLNPPNPMTQLEEVKRRLEDDCKAKLLNKSSRSMGMSSKDKRSMPPPIYPGLSRSVSSTKNLPPQALDLSADSDSLSRSRSAPRRPSTSAPVTPAQGDVTVVGYLFAGDDIPYRTTVPGKNVTLGQFKQLISTKRGNYRFFFKAASDEFGSGVILEEVTSDEAVLPLWEGKVFARLEKVD